MLRRAGLPCPQTLCRIMTDKVKPPSWFSELLARGLLVIRAFDAGAQRLRPTDVAKRTGLNRAAARRYMLTLQDLGYLGSDDDRFSSAAEGAGPRLRLYLVDADRPAGAAVPERPLGSHA